MKIITRQELCRKMTNDEPFSLVEVLPTECYEDAHLPGAINIPLGEEFEALARQALPDKGREIVTYGSDENGSASPMAAKRLEQLGYERVMYYEFGKLDWKQAGSGL